MIVLSFLHCYVITELSATLLSMVCSKGIDCLMSLWVRCLEIRPLRIMRRKKLCLPTQEKTNRKVPGLTRTSGKKEEM